MAAGGALSRAVRALLEVAAHEHGAASGSAEKFNPRWLRWGSTATIAVPGNTTGFTLNVPNLLANQLVRVDERRPRSWNLALFLSVGTLLPADPLTANWLVTIGVGQASSTIVVPATSAPTVSAIIPFIQLLGLPAQKIQVQFQVPLLQQLATDLQGGIFQISAYAAPVHHEGPDEWAV